MPLSAPSSWFLGPSVPEVVPPLGLPGCLLQVAVSDPRCPGTGLRLSGTSLFPLFWTPSWSGPDYHQHSPEAKLRLQVGSG
jgi:hypothetical protein